MNNLISLKTNSLNFLEHDAWVRLCVLVETSHPVTSDQKESLRSSVHQLIAETNMHQNDIAFLLFQSENINGFLNLEFTKRLLLFLDVKMICLALSKFEPPRSLSLFDFCVNNNFLQYGDIHLVERLLSGAAASNSKDQQCKAPPLSSSLYALIGDLSQLANLSPPQNFEDGPCLRRFLLDKIKSKNFLAAYTSIESFLGYFSEDVSARLLPCIIAEENISMLCRFLKHINPVYFSKNLSSLRTASVYLLSLSEGVSCGLKYFAYCTLIPSLLHADPTQLGLPENRSIITSFFMICRTVTRDREERLRLYNFLEEYPNFKDEVDDNAQSATYFPRKGVLWRNFPSTFVYMLSWQTSYPGRRSGKGMDWIVNELQNFRDDFVMREMLYNAVERLLTRSLMDDIKNDPSSERDKSASNQVSLFKLLHENSLLDWDSFAQIVLRIMRALNLESQPLSLSRTAHTVATAFVAITDTCSSSTRNLCMQSGNLAGLMVGPVAYLFAFYGASAVKLRPRQRALSYLLGAGSETHFLLTLEVAQLYSRIYHTDTSNRDTVQQSEPYDGAIRQLLHALLEISQGISQEEFSHITLSGKSVLSSSTSEQDRKEAVLPTPEFEPALSESRRDIIDKASLPAQLVAVLRRVFAPAAHFLEGSATEIEFQRLSAYDIGWADQRWTDAELLSKLPSTGTQGASFIISEFETQAQRYISLKQRCQFLKIEDISSFLESFVIPRIRFRGMDVPVCVNFLDLLLSVTDYIKPCLVYVLNTIEYSYGFEIRNCALFLRSLLEMLIAAHTKELITDSDFCNTTEDFVEIFCEFLKLQKQLRAFSTWVEMIAPLVELIAINKKTCQILMDALLICRGMETRSLEADLIRKALDQVYQNGNDLGLSNEDIRSTSQINVSIT